MDVFMLENNYEILMSFITRRYMGALNRDASNRYLFSSKPQNGRDMFFLGLVCYKYSVNIIRIV